MHDDGLAPPDDNEIGWQISSDGMAPLVKASEFICAQLFFLLLPCMARLVQKNAA
jgi:hypothetical protein